MYYIESSSLGIERKTIKKRKEIHKPLSYSFSGESSFSLEITFRTFSYLRERRGFGVLIPVHQPSEPRERVIKHSIETNLK